MLFTRLQEGSHLLFYVGVFHWEDVQNIPLKLQGKFYFLLESLPEQQGYGFLIICKTKLELYQRPAACRCHLKSLAGAAT